MLKDFLQMSTRQKLTKERLLVHGYINYLRPSSDTVSIDLDSLDGYVFKGDFFSFLTSQDKPENVHLPLLRLNNLASSGSFDGDAKDIKLLTVEAANNTIDFLQKIKVDEI